MWGGWIRSGSKNRTHDADHHTQTALQVKQILKAKHFGIAMVPWPSAEGPAASVTDKTSGRLHLAAACPDHAELPLQNHLKITSGMMKSSRTVGTSFIQR